MDVQQQPEAAAQQTKRKKLATRTKVALWCILGPLVILVVMFILFAVVNSTLDTLPALNAINSVILSIGVISGVVWFPGMIVGVILLSKKPKQQ